MLLLVHIELYFHDFNFFTFQNQRIDEQHPPDAHCRSLERGHRREVARGQARHPQSPQSSKDHWT